MLAQFDTQTSSNYPKYWDRIKIHKKKIKSLVFIDHKKNYVKCYQKIFIWKISLLQDSVNLILTNFKPYYISKLNKSLF